MNAESIRIKLLLAFPGGRVEVTDLTGTNDHFQVTVMSERFEGLSLIEQHKLVYSQFEEEMQGPIHAFSVKTITPTQWAKQKGAVT